MFNDDEFAYEETRRKGAKDGTLLMFRGWTTIIKFEGPSLSLDNLCISPFYCTCGLNLFIRTAYLLINCLLDGFISIRNSLDMKRTIDLVWCRRKIMGLWTRHRLAEQECSLNRENCSWKRESQRQLQVGW